MVIALKINRLRYGTALYSISQTATAKKLTSILNKLYGQSY